MLQNLGDSRVRRNLLRLLHDLAPPCTVMEIVESGPDLLERALPREIAYHVALLERFGAIEKAGFLVTSTGDVPMYVSAVSANPIVLELLATTAIEDRA